MSLRILSAAFALTASFANAQGVLQALQQTPLGATERDTLALIFHPAPNPIDWSSPGAMARSAIWNSLTGADHPLSHVDVYVGCKGEKPLLTGMSRVRNLMSYWKIISSGDSMDLLTNVYPGRSIGAEESQAYTRGPLQKGKVRVLSLNVNAKACARVLAYWTEYQKRGYQNTYSGFTSNPFRGEGAGCAAFAVSFLSVAGMIEDEFKAQWMRHLDVPARLFRSPEGRDAETGFWGFVLLRKDEAWAGIGEPAKRIDIYDPELMYEWVERAGRGLTEFKGRLSRVAGSLELTADRSAMPVPAGDYWNYIWPP